MRFITLYKNIIDYSCNKNYYYFNKSIDFSTIYKELGLEIIKPFNNIHIDFDRLVIRTFENFIVI